MMTSATKRKFIRKKVDFTIEVSKMTRADRPVSNIQQFRFSGIEIAAGGLGVMTNAPVQVNDVLHLKFTLPGEKRTLQLLGRVKSAVKGVPPNPLFPIRAGLAFESISPDDQTYLTNHVTSTFLMY
ncbi:PilZ domain-containing protein [Bdellovibrionota bacterium FG-1]